MVVCPASMVVSTPQVSWTDPIVSDNVMDPQPSVTCIPPSGSTFPEGQSVVTCTAIDSVGNEASCTFIISTGIVYLY